MLEMDQDFERARDHRVRSTAGDIDDKTQAARIVLE